MRPLVRLLDPLYRWLTKYMESTGMILSLGAVGSALGGGGPKPPATPDFTGAAMAQNAWQSYANRPNQSTPWANTSWNATPIQDPATGQWVNQWSQNQNLNPQTASSLDQQMQMQQGRSGIANSLMPQVAANYNQPFNWAGMPQFANTPMARYTSPTGQQTSVDQYSLDKSAPTQTTQTIDEPTFSGQRNRIEQGLFDRMRPEHQFQSSALETQLANQGLTPGSEAYDRARRQLGDQQSREMYDAMQTAGDEQQRLQQMLLTQQGQAFGQDVTSQQAQNAALQGQFGQGLQAGQFGNQANQNLFAQNLAGNQQNFNQDMMSMNAQNNLRNQVIQDEMMRRGMPLYEINQLMQNQGVQNPQMPSFVTSSGPDLTGAMNNMYQGQLDSYNAGQAGNQGFMSGLFGLGGSALNSKWLPGLFGMGGSAGAGADLASGMALAF